METVSGRITDLDITILSPIWLLQLISIKLTRPVCHKKINLEPRLPFIGKVHRRAFLKHSLGTSVLNDYDNMARQLLLSLLGKI